MTTTDDPVTDEARETWEQMRARLGTDPAAWHREFLAWLSRNVPTASHGDGGRRWFEQALLAGRDTVPDGVMRQEAPYPTDLADLVDRVRYRPDWQTSLLDLDRGQGCAGLTLVITTQGFDSYHPDRGQTYRVNHYMPVPAAAYNRQSWLRWLFEQFLLVERHEAMEFFALRHEADGGYTLADGSHADHYDERPYAPNHGHGHDPYTVRELNTREAQRTNFRNEVKPDGD